MNWCRQMIQGALGGLAWAWLGLGAAQAVETIPPTDPATLKLIANPSVTVSLYQLDSTLPSTVTLSSPSRCTAIGTPLLYRDVTDCWLPESGKDVFVVINGAATATVTLVSPASATFPLASGASNPFLALRNPTTSAYPGQCTNFDNPAPLAAASPDFTAPDGGLTLSSVPLSTAIGTVTGWGLRPNDCGGMAVIRVATATQIFTFILPKDGTTTVAANGIPEIWENLYGGNLSPSGDIDTGPGATAPTGDGISTIDEYRGFIASGKQIRTNPQLKDVFVRLVNAQCPTATSPTPGLLITPAGGYPKPTNPSASATLTLPGTTAGVIGTFTAGAAVFTSANTFGEIIQLSGGTVVGRARILAVTSSTTVTALITANFSSTTSSLSSGSWQLSESLFANVFGLLSAERARLLGYTPDAAAGNVLTTNEWVDKFVGYTELGGLQLQATDPASDRVVNANRIYGTPQKGIRVIECLDDGSTSPYGWALGGSGSPNTIGNVVVYTKRIVNQINLLISNSAPRNVQYSPMLTYDSRAKDWLPKTSVGVPTDASVKDFVISKALLFYVDQSQRDRCKQPPFPRGQRRRPGPGNHRQGRQQDEWLQHVLHPLGIWNR